MVETKTDTQNTADRSAQQNTISRPLPYDPVVEAIRILARRGRQLREAEERAAAQAALNKAGDELLADTNENLD
jgi:hypothetical protein